MGQKGRKARFLSTLKCHTRERTLTHSHTHTHTYTHTNTRPKHQHSSTLTTLSPRCPSLLLLQNTVYTSLLISVAPYSLTSVVGVFPAAYGAVLILYSPFPLSHPHLLRTILSSPSPTHSTLSADVQHPLFLTHPQHSGVPSQPCLQHHL
jgi:hypothetical protein